MLQDSSGMPSMGIWPGTASCAAVSTCGGDRPGNAPSVRQGRCIREAPGAEAGTKREQAGVVRRRLINSILLVYLLLFSERRHEAENLFHRL